MRDAYVVGSGMIEFGEHYDRSFDDLIEGAYLDLLADVDGGVEPSDIDAAWYGTIDFANEGSSGASLAHATGLFETPVTRVENACATGSDAFRNASLAVRAGEADLALVLGAEKMLDDTAGLIQSAAVERLWRGRGVTMPAFFGMRATRHMAVHGTTKDQIAEISVKNHANGAKYPYAHQRFECSIEDVEASPTVSYPLNLYDCCPVTDGASAVLLASEEVAFEYADEPVRHAGWGLSSDSFQRGDDRALTNFPASRQASSRAYERSGYGPDDVDVAEVHDCFSITELITYEDLGFCADGEGGAYVESGEPWLDGEKPVNPSGGLLSKGHPIGATGVAQIAEIYEQLRGEAGPVQVDDPAVGLQHNIGIGRNATGAVSCVNLFDRP
jgi:acetyl-CoA C-acetyltransferase